MARRRCPIRDYRKRRLWFVVNVIYWGLRADLYSDRILVRILILKRYNVKEMIQDGFCQPCRYRGVVANCDLKTWRQP